MKRFVDILNILLLIIIVLVIVYTPSPFDKDKEVVIMTKNEIKHIETDVLMKDISEVELVEDTLPHVDDKEEEKNEEEKESFKKPSEDKPTVNKPSEVKPEVKPVPPTETLPPVVKPPVVEPPVVKPVISTHFGSMSGYGPDCYGCSGRTASGYDIYANGINYNDIEYGSVRIVAADRSLPFGSIVRVSNSRLGEFHAIVLDRGGVVGFASDDKHMFDLLFTSNAEALKAGTSYGVTFEVLRLGY